MASALWTVAISVAVAWIALSLVIVFALLAHEARALSRERSDRERRRAGESPRVRTRIVEPEDVAGDVPFNRFLQRHKDR